MANDTAVYDAMRFDVRAGDQHVWTGRAGIREAIGRDGHSLEGMSLRYCPHEWIDDSGYVDLELTRRPPRRP